MSAPRQGALGEGAPAAGEIGPADFPAFFRAMQTWREAPRRPDAPDRGRFARAHEALPACRWDPDEPTHDPFPWQARLVEEVAADGGRWPDLLDLPTGAGKTTAIDVAVFLLALEARHRTERRAALRIAFVVDRRLIVDEAFARAERLAGALHDAASEGTRAPEIVQRVAKALLELAGPGRPPLLARSLRGGAPREDDWAETPCQPTVLCSTVDQVGSRLLFRGYGVSEGMAPVHAGLLGSDALILLDEAHLSEPFRQTARALVEHGKALRGEDESPFHVALLTATPGKPEEDEAASAAKPKEVVFQLSDEDRAHPVLRRRVEAAKPARFVETKATEDERAAALCEQARLMLDALQKAGIEHPAIGVMANRVDRARAAFEALREGLGETAKVLLVIGRARAVDRDRIAADLAPIRTGAPRRLDRPLLVVATQTLEAGVDIDLDALVTEAASLDALRQRFGRVNRDGREVAARGVVLAARPDRRPKTDDPVYGAALPATLALLFPEGGEEVDFGVDAMDARLKPLEASTLNPALAPRPRAPVLMPAYVALWSQTAPRPACDPEPALFLHGPDRGGAGVQLVWRADLELEGEDADARARLLLSLAPPRSTEAVELPVRVAKAWLGGRLDAAGKVADVAEREEGAAPPVLRRPAFVWRGPDHPRTRIVADPGAIRPGDTVVVPASYGGCDRFGWAPASDAVVEDVYDAASEPYARRRIVLRIAPGLIAQALRSFADPEARPALGEVLSDVRTRLAGPASRMDELIGELSGALQSIPDLAYGLRRLRRLRRSPGWRMDLPAFPYGGGEGGPEGVVFVAHAKRNARRARRSWDLQSTAITEDDEAASFRGDPEKLVDHSLAVERRVRDFAQRAGLAPELVEDLALAGWLHDAGKADPRFQALLNASAQLIKSDTLLAKSGKGRSPWGAATRAGLPESWRHEALSVRLAMVNPRLAEAHDRRLVLWLVGTHHGRGRPFFPHADDGPRGDGGVRRFAPVDGLLPRELPVGDGPQRLGFVLDGEAFAPNDVDERDLRGLDWTALFAELREEYGPWGLARLEAVLRLADHRASDGEDG